MERSREEANKEIVKLLATIVKMEVNKDKTFMQILTEIGIADESFYTESSETLSVIHKFIHNQNPFSYY